jgi:hypothetical protein
MEEKRFVSSQYRFLPYGKGDRAHCVTRDSAGRQPPCARVVEYASVRFCEPHRKEAVNGKASQSFSDFSIECWKVSFMHAGIRRLHDQKPPEDLLEHAAIILMENSGRYRGASHHHSKARLVNSSTVGITSLLISCSKTKQLRCQRRDLRRDRISPPADH